MVMVMDEFGDDGGDVLEDTQRALLRCDAVTQISRRCHGRQCQAVTRSSVPSSLR